MYPTLESRADILKMLDEMTDARKLILRRCEDLRPAQLNDSVYPGTWSVLQNLQHLAWAEAWMLAGAEALKERPPSGPRRFRHPPPSPVSWGGMGRREIGASTAACPLPCHALSARDDLPPKPGR